MLILLVNKIEVVVVPQILNGFKTKFSLLKELFRIEYYCLISESLNHFLTNL